jgi:hypothetical protein
MESIKLHRVVKLRDLTRIDLICILEFFEKFLPTLFEQLWTLVATPS